MSLSSVWPASESSHHVWEDVKVRGGDVSTAMSRRQARDRDSAEAVPSSGCASPLETEQPSRRMLSQRHDIPCSSLARPPANNASPDTEPTTRNVAHSLHHLMLQEDAAVAGAAAGPLIGNKNTGEAAAAGSAAGSVLAVQHPDDSAMGHRQKPAVWTADDGCSSTTFQVGSTSRKQPEGSSREVFTASGEQGANVEQGIIQRRQKRLELVDKARRESAAILASLGRGF